MKAVPLYVSGVVSALIGIGALVAGGCANDQQAKGHELYNHYCSHCHGESGRQNEGYNWSSMPDPKPKDLTNKAEMSTLKAVSYTHLRAHETPEHLVCRL